jgi:Fe-only nitrogenase delta subunit
MEGVIKDRIEPMIDYIMKKCLWQFHSRAWDRKRQNEEILKITTQLLCKEPVEPESAFDKCYWVDAVCLAEAYQSRFPWLATLAQEEIRALMRALHERLDHLTITGSLNAELTDQHY